MSLLHNAAVAFARTLRGLPRRLRWPALVGASAAIAPIVRRTMTREAPFYVADGPHEIALWKLIVAAGEAGLEFDPVLEIEGLHHFEAAFAADRGVLAVGPHASLTYLIVRHMHSGGRDPVVVTASPDHVVAGMRRPPRTIAAGRLLLAESVRHLRAGDLVCAMLDRPDPAEATFTVETCRGPIHVADPLLRCALSARARILFCDARLARGRARAAFAAPARADSLEGVSADFAAFLQARMRARESGARTV